MRRLVYPLLVAVCASFAACMGTGSAPGSSTVITAPPAASAPALLAANARMLPVAYEIVAEVRHVAETLLKADKLTVDDAENVQKQADNARAALDIARALMVSNPAAADAKLQATMSILNTLRGYLAAKEKG